MSMAERQLLRLHIEAVWHLTLPPFEESLHELVLAQSSPPCSLYLAAFAQEQVAVWRADVVPERRDLLLAQAHRAGAVWEQSLGMRREVVFDAPLISPQQQAQAQQLARVLGADDTDLID